MFQVTRCLAVLLAISFLFSFSTRRIEAVQTTFFGEDEPRVSMPNAIGARNAFFEFLENSGTEDFEGFSDGEVPTTLTFAAETGTLSGSLFEFGDPKILATGFAISGNKLFAPGAPDGVLDHSFDLTFSSPQVAMGFFATDVGDLGEQLTLTFSHSEGGTTEVDVPHALVHNESVLYFGIIDTANPFDSVNFRNTGNTRGGYGLDDVTIAGAIVPEPSTVVLAAFALLGLIAYGWRRRRAAS